MLNTLHCDEWLNTNITGSVAEHFLMSGLWLRSGEAYMFCYGALSSFKAMLGICIEIEMWEKET